MPDASAPSTRIYTLGPRRRAALVAVWCALALVLYAGLNARSALRALRERRVGWGLLIGALALTQVLVALAVAGWLLGG